MTEDIETLKARIQNLEAQISALVAEFGSNKCRPIMDAAIMRAAMGRAEKQVSTMTDEDKRGMIRDWLNKRNPKL